MFVAAHTAAVCVRTVSWRTCVDIGSISVGRSRGREPRKTDVVAEDAFGHRHREALVNGASDSLQINGNVSVRSRGVGIDGRRGPKD